MKQHRHNFSENRVNMWAEIDIMNPFESCDLQGFFFQDPGCHQSEFCRPPPLLQQKWLGYDANDRFDGRAYRGRISDQFLGFLGIGGLKPGEIEDKIYQYYSSNLYGFFNGHMNVEMQNSLDAAYLGIINKEI